MSTIAKNTMLLTLASVGQKAIAFVYFTLIANAIGKEATGDYFLALSITTIFSVVADWGLTPVLIREVAKYPGQAGKILRSIMGMKIPLILLGAAGSIGAAMLLGYSVSVIQLVAVASLVMAADAISLTCFGVLRGLHNLRYESLGIFVGQTITTLIGLAFLFTNPSLPLLIIALLAGSTWNAIYSASRVGKHIGARSLVPSFDRLEMKKWLKLSVAFVLAGAFVKVYSYVDSLILHSILGSGAVGAYAVAYKITYAFQFLPMAFVGALYPLMSTLWGEGKKVELGKLFSDAMWYVMLLAAPIVFGIWSIADKLIPAFYPNGYEEAILPLQILVFALLLLFLDFPIGSLLNAAGKQGVKTAIMGGTMVINAVANIILIPKMGLEGAAISAVLGDAFLLFAGLVMVPRLIHAPMLKLIGRVAPIFISGLLMAGSVILLKPYLHFVLLIGVGAIVYLTVLFMTKALTVEHVRSVYRTMRGGPVTDAV